NSVVTGQGPRGLVDTIVLNAAIGLWSTGKAPDVKSGIAVARDLLLGGAVAQKISDTRSYFES
ncbi:anthranilate phosphoribosyltransferase, partial [Opitutaceae bacterium]|nr:anthranilate phosphoribosyltransferase [Opitutaceae bacterium]